MMRAETVRPYDLDPSMEDDEQAILDLIERETRTFLCRDFEAWADCWVQDEGVRRIGACMGGIMDYHEGWAASAELISQIMRQNPEPNPDAAAAMRRANVSVRIRGDMAAVSYDQYGARSDDPLVTVGLSHQIRIVEKDDTGWRIAMMAFGDTTLEYCDYPLIRIDENARIDWINDVGRDELQNHPALIRSGTCLRGRYPADDKRLQAAIKNVAGLTIMDRRPSIAQPRGRFADPVILTGEAADGQHIVWISIRDGMLLVSFRDSRNERARLEQAAEVFDLSPTQVRVSGLILEGCDLPQIAGRLSISPNTAKTHLTRIFDKTGARSQPALVSRLLGVRPPQAARGTPLKMKGRHSGAQFSGMSAKLSPSP